MATFLPSCVTVSVTIAFIIRKRNKKTVYKIHLRHSCSLLKVSNKVKQIVMMLCDIPPHVCKL